MKSLFFASTGRHDDQGNEIKEPRFLDTRHLAGKSLCVNGDHMQGLDARINAAASTAQEATGYQIAIDTMTFIKQRETKQVYYELQGKSPRDFVPIEVGDGAWAADILTKRTYQNTGNFEAGLVRQGSHDARKTNTTVSLDSVSIPTFLWDDAVQYNLMEIEQALLASNWDIIAGKHAARMKKYQLGIQKIAFLGTSSGSMEGLFVNTKTNVNTAFITAYISGLDAAGFKTFVAGLISAYWTNTASTKLPTHFVIPMLDWLGLQVLVPGSAGTFPVPMLTYLENAFKAICGPDFVIIGNAYADKTIANGLGAPNLNTYALYRKDPESLRMDLPVDFTVTQPGTIDNFNFQDLAYAQLTGVGFYRPLETLLFQF